MTEKVHPSTVRPAESFKTAVGFAYAGGLKEGVIVDGATPTEVAEQDSGIDETQLNAFAESHGGASFDVTIDPGEAFVWGAWLGKDTQTTVTVAASTADQTIYVGWDRNDNDDVIIGLASAFDSATEDEDMKIPLYDVDTDGSGVTAVTDRRAFTSPARIRELVDAPNGTPPNALLEDTESVEITVAVPDGETLKVYRWGAYEVGGGTAPAGLQAQLLDGGDTVQASENTVDTESTDPAAPVASHTNSSGSASIFKLRANNATGNAYTTNGVGSHFAYIVE